MGEDAGIATQCHLAESLDRHRVIVPLNARRRAKEVAFIERLLAGLARDAHEDREAKAAQALEAAEEACRDAHDYLTGRKQ